MAQPCLELRSLVRTRWRFCETGLPVHEALATMENR